MISRGLGILAASIILTACGGSGSSSSTPTPEAPTPEAPTPEAPTPEAPIPEAPTPEAPTPEAPTPEAPTPEAPVVLAEEAFIPDLKAVESVVFVDALNQPLTFSEVVFTPVNQISNFSVAMADTPADEIGSCYGGIDENSLIGTTDDQGDLTLEGLTAGIYRVQICKGDVAVSMEFTILGDNAATSAVIAAPLTVDKFGEATALPVNSIIVAVSGVIYSEAGVIANAQISISGGAMTNGAIATVITDENGFYSIVINMNANKLAALQNATIQIMAEGFENLNVEGQDFTQFGAFSGVNIQLTATEEDAAVLAYEETFEVLSTDATCGEWTSETLIQESLWHTHASNLGVINQAYVASLVSLAPNDLSEGKVPDPIEGLSACWYGKTTTDGSIEDGNFLNEANEADNANELGGGTSARANAGALISPRIDFSAEVIPLALTFKTWWEIEAVNPNENGYDLMSVEYQVEGEETWNLFIRLNPLSDPAGNDLESLPYSNAGFNQAPRWLEQAPISLDRLAGKVFKLRFSFSTEDGLFNGFRGWLLDDVKISHEEGTFPLWDEVDRILISEEEGIPYTEIFNNETGETQFSIDLSVKSSDSTGAQLRINSSDGQLVSESFATTALVQGELQDIQLQGDIIKPEGEFSLVIELVDGSGQVKASYALWGGDEDYSTEEE